MTTRRRIARRRSSRRQSGDGQGVTISSVTRFRDAFMEIQAGLAARIAREPRPGQRDDASRSRASSASRATAGSARSSRTSGRRGTPSPTTRAIPARARCCSQQARTARRRASTRPRRRCSTSCDQRDHAARRASSRRSTRSRSSLAHAQPAIQSGTVAGLNVSTLLDQRDQLAQQLAAAHRRDDPDRPEQQVTVSLGGLNLVSANQSQALTLDTSGPTAVLRAVQGGFAVNVTSGQAGGMLNDINTVLPGLPHAARRCRDDAARPGERRGERDRGLDRRDRAATRARRARCSSASRSTAARSTRSRSPAPTGRARAARPRCRPRCRPRSTPRSAPGNATATVTTNVDGSLSVSVAPTGTHALQVQASGANAGHVRRCSATPPVGTDGIGGRAFFSGTDAAHAGALGAASRATRLRSRPAPSANGPLDASIASASADMSTSTTGADATYNTMIVQLGVDAKDVQTRNNIQQQSVQSLDAARNAQAGVNTDEEMTNMVEYQKAYEASAKFIVDAQLDARDAHQHGRTLMDSVREHRSREGQSDDQSCLRPLAVAERDPAPAVEPEPGSRCSRTRRRRARS